MNVEIEVKAINLKGERFERIYFAWLRMGIAIFAFTDFPIRINQNLYHGCVPGWRTNIHYFSIPNASRYALLWLNSLHLNSIFSCQSLFGILNIRSWYICLTPSFLMLSLAHTLNRSAAIQIMPLLFHFTKVTNIPTTIPIFCTYIKHRNHFPYQTCILSMREHPMGVPPLILSHLIRFARISFWYTPKFNPVSTATAWVWMFAVLCSSNRFESNRQHIYRTQLCILAYIFYLI